MQSNSLSPLYSDHDAVQWGKQIAEGLAFLHTANPVVSNSFISGCILSHCLTIQCSRKFSALREAISKSDQ